MSQATAAEKVMFQDLLSREINLPWALNLWWERFSCLPTEAGNFTLAQWCQIHHGCRQNAAIVTEATLRISDSRTNASTWLELLGKYGLPIDGIILAKLKALRLGFSRWRTVSIEAKESYQAHIRTFAREQMLALATSFDELKIILNLRFLDKSDERRLATLNQMIQMAKTFEEFLSIHILAEWDDQEVREQCLNKMAELASTFFEIRTIMSKLNLEQAGKTLEKMEWRTKLLKAAFSFVELREILDTTEAGSEIELLVLQKMAKAESSTTDWLDQLRFNTPRGRPRILGFVWDQVVEKSEYFWDDCVTMICYLSQNKPFADEMLSFWEKVISWMEEHGSFEQWSSVFEKFRGNDELKAKTLKRMVALAETFDQKRAVLDTHSCGPDTVQRLRKEMSQMLAETPTQADS